MKEAGDPGFGEPRPLILNYGAAATPELMKNLSCAASVGDRLWTVADEGRTLECLKRVDNGFLLVRQYQLDEGFGELVPGRADDEVDLEAMSFDGARLWLCGSHCRVRRKPESADQLDARLRRRASRHFFGALRLDRDGSLRDLAPVALPATGPHSLRRALRQDEYLEPFLGLPSKEGGLDIEGLLVKRGRAFFGCRGPLIDSVAVVM